MVGEHGSERRRWAAWPLLQSSFCTRIHSASSLNGLHPVMNTLMYSPSQQFLLLRVLLRYSLPSMSLSPTRHYQIPFKLVQPLATLD